MPSRVRVLLELNGIFFWGPTARRVNEALQHLRLSPNKSGKTARDRLRADFAKIKASGLYDPLSLTFFREQRFQNPSRSEFAARISSFPKTKKPRGRAAILAGLQARAERPTPPQRIQAGGPPDPTRGGQTPAEDLPERINFWRDLVGNQAGLGGTTANWNVEPAPPRAARPRPNRLDE